MEGSLYRLYYGIHKWIYFFALFKHIQVCFIRGPTVGMYKGVASVTILGFFSKLTIAGIPVGPAFLGLSCFMSFKEPCPEILHMQTGTLNVLSFKLINYDISDNGHKHFDFPTVGEIGVRQP
jgi:hypothetical protein